MTADQDGPRRVFLDWDRPLLERATAYLLKQGRGDFPVDLSRLLVMAPTRNAGRRLREHLAASVREKPGGGLLPPMVRPPEFFLSLGIDDETRARLATHAQSLLAWAEVVREASLPRLRSLFPIEPPQRDFRWCLAVASDLAALRETLGESGLCIADVLGRVPEDFIETRRWENLADLETAYLEKLNALALVDRLTARFDGLESVALPAGIEKVIALATPDPVPLAARVLDRLGSLCEVEIAVFADPRIGEAGFDRWGRPRFEFWTDFNLALDPARLHLCPDPEGQARVVETLISGLNDPVSTVSIGVPDAEVAAAVEKMLTRRDIPAWNPDGRPLRGEGFHYLLRTVAAFARSGEWEDFQALVRCPDFFAWLRSFDEKESRSWNRLLREESDFSQQCLPVNAGHAGGLLSRQAKDYPALRSALLHAEQLRRDLIKGPVEDIVPQFLQTIYASRELRADRAEDAAIIEGGRALMDLAGAVRSMRARGVKLSPLDELDYLVAQSGQQVLYGPSRTSDAVQLQGWLELLWEDAPVLILTGMNDGLVPDTVVGDRFIPEKLRSANFLDLRTNEARFARDAYILAAIERSRDDGRGRVEVLSGKEDGAGDPLRPSRLLFMCDDKTLPARVNHLFGNPLPVEAAPFWQPAWALKPEPVTELQSISVTAFKSYLRCPFRFLLERIHGMQSLPLAKGEMDAMDFGSFIHRLLEEFGRDPAIRDSRSAEEIRGYLHARAGEMAELQFGSRESIPVLLQMEAVKQRLGKFAEIQAQARTDGWRIEEVEFSLGREMDWRLEDVQVRGKIDRIERNENTGRLRVIDYKTSEKAAAPDGEHWTKIVWNTNRENVLLCARFDKNGMACRWKDLQLPLYAAALAERFGEPVDAAYFCLPKAAGETGLMAFREWDDELIAAGLDCAGRIIRAIRNREFWPPVRQNREDDIGALLFEAEQMTVDFSELNHAPRLSEAEDSDADPDA